MSADAFISEAVRRLGENKCDVLYLHPEGEGQAACAIVTIDWLNRRSKAEEDLYLALDSFPETTNHSHLEGGEA